MTKLEWDADGTRIYEGGVSRGVLYLEDGSGVPWNGLIGVNEKVEGESTTPLFRDGAKVMDVTERGDYSATLTVFTYPDEFMEYDGYHSLGGGLYAKNQQPKQFGLSYRTEVGDDLEGLGSGYKIHVVWNITAEQSAVTYTTLGASVDPIDFVWELGATPEYIPGYKATAHLVIDSRRIEPYLLVDLEDVLYGTDATPSRLPRLAELQTFVTEWELITITLGPDGSVTFTGPEELLTMVSDEEFQIDSIFGEYSDAYNYTVSTTTAMEV